MSGALLLLAQLFPVKEAFHLSILDDKLSQDIEDYGKWDELEMLEQDDPEKYRRILEPEQGDVESLILPIDKCPDIYEFFSSNF